MKQTYRLSILLIAMMQFSSLLAQWDCCSPDPFFAPGSPYFVIATGGPGKEDDVSCSCLSGENGGYWIAFSAASSGTFEMMIEPNAQPAANFDFAMWADHCPCGGGGAGPPIFSISCNNVSGTGPTGIADKPEVTFGVPATSQWSETVFLNAGRNYYLLISDMTSGSAGFTITTAGTASLGELIEDDFGLTIAGPPTVCPGGEAVFTATSQQSPLPTYYGWEVSQVSPYGYYYQVATGTQPFVAIDEFPYPGSYEVCVTISNEEIGCKESAPVCTTINVVPLPNPAGYETGTVCTNDVYVAANGEAFYFGGVFDVHYLSWQGCDSIVQLTLTQYPSPYVIINKTVCAGNCVEFNGQTVCDPGFYEEILPSFRGCDSTTVLNLIALPIKTIITGGGTIDCITTSLTLNSNTSVYANNPQYRWRKGNVVVGTNPSLIVTSGGTYSLTIKSNIGLDTCMDVATIIIGQNTEPPQNVVATGGTINCYSSQVTLTGSSSTPNVTYAWTGPNGYTSNLQSPTVFTPGTYTLKVTGTNGCTKTASAVVNENKTLPDAVATANGTLNCNASVVLVNGAGSSIGSQYSYLWTTTNGNISGDPTSLSPGVNAPGTYLLTVTNTINGCTKTASTVVVQRPTLTTNIASSSNVSCFGGQNGAASISVSGGDGNYSIVWSNGSSTSAVSGLGAGGYNVIVTDGDGCTSSQNLTITQPDLLLANASATGQTQMGVNNGTVSANPSGGVPNYTYAWTNENGNSIGNSSNLSGLAPGNYTVVVTDGNGCTALQTITVSEVACTVKANVEQNNVSCFGLSDGSATINLESATPPYSYSWSNGANTQTATGLAAGTYFVSSTDAFGCEVVTTVVIEAPQSLDANVATTPLTSYNSNDGSASASPNGGTAPYSYSWSNGSTMESIANLAPGNYTVVVTDANGCSDEQAISIDPFDCGFFASAVATNISCNGLTDGTATANLAGGVAPFDYLWSNGETTATINGLAAGIYTVAITDEIGCPATAEVTIIEPAALGVAVVNMVEASCASSNGLLEINATGGTPGYTLLWENGETTSMISGLVAGIYNVVVTDANNCVDNFDVVLGTDDEVPPIVLTQNITIELSANGTAITSPNAIDNGSTDNCAISSYSLSQTDFDCTDLGDNNITLTVTDVGNNSVSANAVVTVVDNTPPVLSLQNTTLVIGAGGTITLTPLQIDNGSTDNCAITNWTFSQTSFGCDDVGPNDVTVTASDASGNIATGTIVVTIQETTPPTINCPASFALAGCDAIGVFDVTATDNCVGAVVLTQTAGPSSGSTFPAGTTTVSFTATDVSGNTVNCSFTVTVAPTLSVTTSVTNVDCHGDDTGSATATPNGGLAPFNYIWSNGATTATTSNLTIGSYTVSVTDAGGCTSVQTVSISEPPLLVTALVSITNATYGQANGTIDVNVTGGVSPYTYNWLNSAGVSVGNTQDIDGLAPGTYTLSVMDANGCVSLSGFTIQNSTGTDEADLDTHVMLYPNPTSGKVTLELVDLPNIGSVQVSAFDVTGRSVLQQSSASSKQLLDFSALPGGVYMLKIVIGEEMLLKRLVVSK